MKEPGLQSRNADAVSQVLFLNMSSLECRCLEESMWGGGGGQVHINTVEELGNMAAFHCLSRKKKHCDLRSGYFISYHPMEILVMLSFFVLYA